MKFTDGENTFNAYYDFGGERFGAVQHLGDGIWRLSAKGKNVVLGLDELMALHTLVAKAIVVEKQRTTT